MHVTLGDKTLEEILMDYTTDEEKTTVYLNANFTYKYNGKQYSQKTQKGIRILASKVDFQLEATRQEASGNLVEYMVRLINNTDTNLNNAEIRMLYPNDFIFSGSPINAVDDNNSIFKLPTIAPKEKFEMVIKGTLEGTSAESKKVCFTWRKNPKRSASDGLPRNG